MAGEEIFGPALYGFLFVFIALLIVSIVLWILTLIHQAKRSRWVWFVLTLIGIPLVFPLYWFVWIVSPEFRRTKKKRR